MPRLKRKQAELAMKLVVAGLPGQVASVVGAACYDQRNLNPRLGSPVQGERASLDSVRVWFQRTTGQGLDAIQPRPGAIPDVTSATADEVNLLLDEIFGHGRPDLYSILGVG